MTNKFLRWVTTIKALFETIGLFMLVYMLVITAVYLLLILLPEKIFQFRFEFSAIIYIIFSTTAIILTTWGNKINSRIRRLFFKGYTGSVYKQMLDQKNFRFVLMFVYFIAIIVFTLASLMSHTFFSSDKMEYSIIQSFATYIAYDRLIRNYPTTQREKNK